MIFNSLAFLVFFPVVTVCYWLLPHRLRIGWLLIASCFFYMYAVPLYILILFAMIVIDYGAAIWIRRTTGAWRKTALITSIAGNGLLLFSFKYYNFFNDLLTPILDMLHLQTHLPYSNWILPIGLSFHTLQSIAYIVDIYRNSIKPEKNLIIFALFVMFYPQLVAGPIERARNMLPQFHRKQTLQLSYMVEGGRLILWGLFQKVVIADRLALVVDKVYQNPESHSPMELLLASIFFFLQVYCDFCGYSDIARGSARMMGFELSTNFNNPLAATNMVDFWSRWHISLTSWIRTYLFYPLMRSRLLGSWTVFNVMAMFIFSGLWHGAQMTFVVWGILLGVVYLLQRRIPKPKSKRKENRLGKGYTLIKICFNITLISLICVFFRAEDMHQALRVFRGLFVTGFHESFPLSQLLVRLEISLQDLIINLGLAVTIIFLQAALRASGKSYAELVTIPDRMPGWSRWLLYYALIFGIVLLGVFNENQFVYFQF